MTRLRTAWADTGWPMVAFLVAFVAIVAQFTHLLAVM